jgi:hypothetical protein
MTEKEDRVRFDVHHSGGSEECLLLLCHAVWLM